MPFDVAKSTVTSLPAAAESVTVMLVAVLFSLEVVTSLIDKEGVASSSVIVNVPVASLIVAFEALDKVMVTVSFASSNASVSTVTGIVLDVSPALNVKVPFVAV